MASAHNIAASDAIRQCTQKTPRPPSDGRKKKLDGWEWSSTSVFFLNDSLGSEKETYAGERFDVVHVVLRLQGVLPLVERHETAT